MEWKVRMLMPTGRLTLTSMILWRRQRENQQVLQRG